MNPVVENKSPLFSVLMANYNNGGYISEAIESVINQTYSNWEIVIVDDASTDNSLEVIQKHIDAGVNINLFTNETNKGCGAAKKSCVERSHGKICAFLDPDDVLTEDALELMTEQHILRKDVSLAYSSLYYCTNSLEIKHPAEWIRQVPAHTTNLHVNYISQLTSFKKSFYLETEGIDPELRSSVDKDLYYKLEEVGKVYYVDKPLYLYRENKHGISQLDNLITAQDNHLKVIRMARERRSKNGYPNLTTREYHRIVSKLYLNRSAFLKKRNKSRASIIKNIMKSFFYCPIENNKERLRLILSMMMPQKTSP